MLQYYLCSLIPSLFFLYVCIYKFTLTRIPHVQALRHAPAADKPEVQRLLEAAKKKLAAHDKFVQLLLLVFIHTHTHTHTHTERERERERGRERQTDRERELFWWWCSEGGGGERERGRELLWWW